MSGKGAPPGVAAVVVNYNGWRDTIECVESLLRSDYEALSVIVCDNASTDGSLGRLKEWARGAQEITPPVANLLALTFPPVPKPVALAEYSRDEFELLNGAPPGRSRVILVDCGSNLGFAGANNVGLRYMQRGTDLRYALLLNSDAVIAPGALRAMVETAEAGGAKGAEDVGAVGATVLRYDRPEDIETLAGARLNRLSGMTTTVNEGSRRGEPRPRSPRIDYVTGCCVLVPRHVVAKVGLMDERYFLYGEDTDWGLRMTRAGFRLAYCPEAEVWHKGGASVVHRSAVHDYYDVRGRLMLMHKHFPMALPFVLAHSFARCILPKLLRGEWDRLRAAARGYTDFIAYARRHRVNAPAAA